MISDLDSLVWIASCVIRRCFAEPPVARPRALTICATVGETGSERLRNASGALVKTVMGEAWKPRPSQRDSFQTESTAGDHFPAPLGFSMNAGVLAWSANCHADKYASLRIFAIFT